MSRSITKNISILTLANLSVKPAWFVFITYVCIRQLGVANYGIVTAALAIMSISDGLLNMGVAQYSIREIARKKDRSTMIFSNLLSLRFGTAVLAIGIGIAVEIAIGNGSLLLVALFAGTYVLGRSLAEYCRTVMRAHEQFTADAVSGVLEKVLVIAIGSAFIFTTPTPSSLLIGMSIGMLVTFVGIFRYVSTRLAQFDPASIRKRFYSVSLPSAIPLGLASIFVLIYFRTDTFMIEAMLGPLEAGQYAVGFRILEALTIIPATVVTVLLPRLSISFGDQADVFKRLSVKWVTIILTTGGLVAAAIHVGSDGIVGLLVEPPDSVIAAGILRVLIWSFPLSAANYVISTVFVASRRQNTLAIILGTGAVSNVVLNFILIPSSGASGAAIATIVTQVFITIGFALAFALNGSKKVR